MSAIAGVVRFDGGPVEHGIVQAMTKALAHRGPDGRDHWQGDGAALGQAMLRTTPESLQEVQPLVDDRAGHVLVMDGRVDNWEELRAEFEAAGAPLRSHADAELVLRAYQVWGSDCLAHIDGDFALAIWDRRHRQLFCARDRLGARPFYYHWDGRHFSFASELHAVLGLSWVPEVLNEAKIAEKLAYDERSLTETFWRGIHRLDAAAALCVGRDGPKVQSYWQPQIKPEIRYRRLDDYAEHYRDLLLDSVRRVSRTQQRLACEVSGGIDSSSVFSVADQLQRSGRLLAPDLQGYTLNFNDGSPADEVDFARAVGRHLDRAIREVPPSLEPIEWYDTWIETYRDFPHYPNTVMAHSIHHAMLEDGCRVVLTGYGGDEWQMGSPYYYADYLRMGQFGAYLATLRDDARAFGRRQAIYHGLRYGIVALLPSDARDLLKRLRHGLRTPRKRGALRLCDRLEALHHARDGQFKPVLPRGAAPRHEISFQTLHSEYRRVARESFNVLASAVGVEPRDPMTSTAIAEFHFRTPDTIRQRANEFRICHRRAMLNRLPERVRNRASKADFSSTLRNLSTDILSYDRKMLVECAERWLHEEECREIQLSVRNWDHSMFELSALWGLFGCARLAARVGRS